MVSALDASTTLASVIAGSETENVVMAMLSEFFWLAAGFAAIRLLMQLGLVPKLTFDLGRRHKGSETDPKRRAGVKQLVTAASAGQPERVLAAWDEEKSAGAFPLDALKDVTQALSQLAPERLVTELSTYVSRTPLPLPHTTSLNALLDVIVLADRPDLASELCDELQKKVGVRPNARSREILIGGFAAVGNDKKVAELEGRENNVGEMTLRGYTLALRGLLKNGNVTAAIEQMMAMCDRGMEVPPRAVSELFKVMRPNGLQAIRRALCGLRDRVPMSVDSAASILTDCLVADDVGLASRIENLVREHNTPMHYSVYEPLLKLYAKAGNPQAQVLFANLEKDGFYASEGLCGNLLARSGEAKDSAFAEAIVAYLRRRSMMTLATYKTLMKVYATAGEFDRACDLYADIIADGIQPDHVMYGCLVKFAVKCGRMKLSQELFEKSKGGDIQNFMWLIRAAGRDGDVKRAMTLLRQVENSHPNGLDIAVYNCTLDVCVSSGYMEQGWQLLSEITDKGLANHITFNTLVKGYCAQGDTARAREVFEEMSAAGLSPDSASYNCILGTVASSGHVAELFNIMKEMDSKGVPIDHYTVSIMMKAAKRARNPRDAERLLAVLDRASAVNVCQDDILLNTVLDACIQRKDTLRLKKVLESFTASDMQASVHTYGLLIKAYCLLKDHKYCWTLWREMTVKRNITPTNITLSCMLDAVISCGQVDEAVALFREWKEHVPPNTIMYSTLIKGFATACEADRAMEMFKELKAEGLQMNLVAYTSLIDAQARAGKMDRATRVFQEMQQDGCQPNVITYSTMVKGFCLQGDLDEALNIFSAMVESGLSADTVLFNTLLDGCVRHSRFELADQVFADMGKHNVEPSNFTHSIVVKMWGKRRQLNKAFDVVRTLATSRRGFLDPQVGSCLISACFHNQAVSKATQAFEELRSYRGCEADSSIYSAYVSGLARYGECRLAVQTLKQASEEMQGRSLYPECVSALRKALVKHGLEKELGETLDRHLKADVSNQASRGPLRRYASREH